MHGEEPQPAELIVDDWLRCRDYLRGIDLFNHGYYWEAHEVWEGLWHTAGHRGRSRTSSKDSSSWPQPA